VQRWGGEEYLSIGFWCRVPAILARDIGGRMVVLENQFGPDRSHHLGQIMTYVALRDRKFRGLSAGGDGFEPSVIALYRARTAPFGTLGRYAAHRVDDAGEFHEHAVAGRLDAPESGSCCAAVAVNLEAVLIASFGLFSAEGHPTCPCTTLVSGTWILTMKPFSREPREVGNSS
jgi:hypothetical protein